MSSEPPNFNPKNIFGPGTADVNAQPAHPPAAAAPPRPVSAPLPLLQPLDRAALALPAHESIAWWQRRRVRYGLIVVIGCLPALYFSLTSSGFRGAGAGGFIGLSLALIALLAAAAKLTLDRERPAELTLAALSAGSGAGALLIAGMLAHSLRNEADAIAASNVAHEPGMREFLIAEAHGNGRTCALIGLLGIPGAMLGGLSLALVLGARRVARGKPSAAASAGLTEAPVWVAFAGSALAVVVGFVSAVWAAVLPVEDAKNPREARLVAIADAQARGDLKAACDELEEVLAPSFVSEAMLEQRLPGRAELAHRCITLRIDALPLGRACEPAVEKLSASETVKLAKAHERVRQACKGR